MDPRHRPRSRTAKELEQHALGDVVPVVGRRNGIDLVIRSNLEESPVPQLTPVGLPAPAERGRVIKVDPGEFDREIPAEILAELRILVGLPAPYPVMDVNGVDIEPKIRTTEKMQEGGGIGASRESDENRRPDSVGEIPTEGFGKNVDVEGHEDTIGGKPGIDAGRIGEIVGENGGGGWT